MNFAESLGRQDDSKRIMECPGSLDGDDTGLRVKSTIVNRRSFTCETEASQIPKRTSATKGAEGGSCS